MHPARFQHRYRASIAAATPVNTSAAVRSLVVAAALVLAGSVSAALSTAAQAHSAVKSSTPAAGSVVDELPATLSLTFGERVLSASVNLTDGCGTRLRTTASIDGTAVTAVPRGGANASAPGRWSIDWKAVGGDGHPVSGQIHFTLRGQPDCGAGVQALGAAQPGQPTPDSVRHAATPNERGTPASGQRTPGGPHSTPAAGQTPSPEASRNAHRESALPGGASAAGPAGSGAPLTVGLLVALSVVVAAAGTPVVVRLRRGMRSPRDSVDGRQ